VSPDLRYALMTSNDCTCTRDRIDDPDRLPRILRVTDPGCVDHGDNAARVLPDLSDIVNEAWEGIPS
jgi:hypothetical protein